MKAYQNNFIEIQPNANSLKFGQFMLKSEQISLYFFNIGALLNAKYYVNLGKIYAEAIVDSGVDYLVLKGRKLNINNNIDVNNN